MGTFLKYLSAVHLASHNLSTCVHLSNPAGAWLISLTSMAILVTTIFKAKPNWIISHLRRDLFIIVLLYNITSYHMPGKGLALALSSLFVCYLRQHTTIGQCTLLVEMACFVLLMLTIIVIKFELPSKQ